MGGRLLNWGYDWLLEFRDRAIAKKPTAFDQALIERCEASISIAQNMSFANIDRLTIQAAIVLQKLQERYPLPLPE